MEEKARPAARKRGRWHGPSFAVRVGDDVQLAGAVGEELLQKIERLIDRLRIRERPEVPGAPIAERPRAQHARKILTESDLHVRI